MDDEGLLFTLKQLKTDSLGRGTTIHVGHCNPPMCATSTIATYVISSGSPQDPLFHYRMHVISPRMHLSSTSPVRSCCCHKCAPLPRGLVLHQQSYLSCHCLISRMADSCYGKMAERFSTLLHPMQLNGHETDCTRTNLMNVHLLYFLACSCIFLLGCGPALCIFGEACILARGWLSGHSQPYPTHTITVGHRLYVCCLLFRATGHFVHTLLRSHGSLCAYPAPSPSHPYPDNNQLGMPSPVLSCLYYA